MTNENTINEFDSLLAEANALREKLQKVEQALYDLDYDDYCYITGVIKRKSEA